MHDSTVSRVARSSEETWTVRLLSIADSPSALRAFVSVGYVEYLEKKAGLRIWTVNTGELSFSPEESLFESILSGLIPEIYLSLIGRGDELTTFSRYCDRYRSKDLENIRKRFQNLPRPDTDLSAAVALRPILVFWTSGRNHTCR
jgi:hypothetical protein